MASKTVANLGNGRSWAIRQFTDTGRAADFVKIAPNTYLIREDEGSIAVAFYGTKILRFEADGSETVINSYELSVSSIRRINLLAEWLEVNTVNRQLIVRDRYRKINHNLGVNNVTIKPITDDDNYPLPTWVKAHQKINNIRQPFRISTQEHPDFSQYDLYLLATFVGFVGFDQKYVRVNLTKATPSQANLKIVQERGDEIIIPVTNIHPSDWEIFQAWTR